jgi:hypothetical protein
MSASSILVANSIPASVVKLIAHKFVEGNKKREKKGWFGRLTAAA